MLPFYPSIETAQQDSSNLPLLQTAPARRYLFMRHYLFCPNGLSCSHSSCEVVRQCACACVRLGVGCQLYLRVEWRWQISELRDVCLERSQVVVVTIRTIAALQAVPPLGFWYGQVTVARWCCSVQKKKKRGCVSHVFLLQLMYKPDWPKSKTTRKTLHTYVWWTHLRVSPGGPASSLCCCCCWCWRCGWHRRAKGWSRSPGAGRETGSGRQGRPRTPEKKNQRKNKHLLRRSGSIPGRRFCLTWEQRNSADPVCLGAVR